MESSRRPEDRLTGAYIRNLRANTFEQYAIQAMPNFDKKRIKAEILDVKDIAALVNSVPALRFQPIPESGGYAFSYLYKGNTEAISTNIKKDGNNVVQQLLKHASRFGSHFFWCKNNL